MSETTNEQTVNVLFSRDGRLYYVESFDHLRPTAWVSVAKNAEGKYDVLPFALYDVKGGERKVLLASDPLVQRYGIVLGWPPRRSVDWHEQLDHDRRRAREQYAEEMKSARWWKGEVARLDALFDANPIIGGPNAPQWRDDDA